MGPIIPNTNNKDSEMLKTVKTVVFTLAVVGCMISTLFTANVYMNGSSEPNSTIPEQIEAFKSEFNRFVGNANARFDGLEKGQKDNANAINNVYIKTTSNAEALAKVQVNQGWQYDITYGIAKVTGAPLPDEKKVVVPQTEVVRVI